MPQFSKTWWGQKFITALEDFSDDARLGRGRSYARNGKITEYQITNGKIAAKVRGSVNPYFGVYKEPLYKVSIEIKQISKTDWSKIVSHLGSKASLISKLLLGEVPDNIESAFADLKLHLLPHTRQDFKIDCSCPDWGDPCKHIAGVYYLVAAELDRDPLLLFELRGISRLQLRQELSTTPLGKALSSALDEGELQIEPVASYHTHPLKLARWRSLSPGESLPTDPRDFWQGERRIPQVVSRDEVASIPAVVVKKGGDFPPFWQQDSSFLEVMVELYDRVRKKNI
jgi:uncharacterized Zn finger protein